jgi:hypothetical protein
MVAAAVRAGSQVDPVGTAWEFRASRLLDCLDPEGNVVQLRQLEAQAGAARSGQLTGWQQHSLSRPPSLSG